VLRALAGEGCVTLRWSTLDLRDLVSQEIWRRREGGVAVRLAGGLGPEVTSWTDAGLPDGERLHYWLVWRLGPEGSEERSLPEAWARPGSAIVWVAGVEGGGLWRVTPDGQHRLFSVGWGSSVVDLTVDPGTGRVWGADPEFGQILQSGARGETTQIAFQQGVSRVSFDPVLGWLWAASFLERRLVAYDSLGQRVLDLELAGHATDLDAQPGRGVIVALGEGPILRVRTSGEAESLATVVRPGAVLWDSLACGLWILDEGSAAVAFLPEGGDSVEVVARNLGVPVDLAADGRGRCWVADAGGRIHRVALGAGLVETWGVGGEPAGVAVDLLREEIWVALPDPGRLLLLDAEGQEISRWEGSGGPWKVEGAWAPEVGTGCPPP
jgi:hypothetical protein